MRHNLENCPVCHNRLAADDDVCPHCRNSYITDIDLIDVADRVNHRNWLNEKRAQWNELNQILRDELTILGKIWRENKKWRSIWAKIEHTAKKSGIRERDATKLAKKLWEEIKLPRPDSTGEKTVEKEKPDVPPSQDKSKEEAARETQPPADSDATKIRKQLVSWVAGLPNDEWNVDDWTDFLDSLDGTFDETEMAAARDAEIKRQFFRFETASLTSDGSLINTRKSVVRQYVQQLDEHLDISLIRVPAGSFEMGAADGFKHENPVRRVHLSEFYLGKFPITQAQWLFVSKLPPVNLELEPAPSYFTGDECPVDSVSWIEANEFCERLSRLTGGKYRLPSEAEWEYAARAGSRTAFAFGDAITPKLANFDGRKAFAEADAFAGKTRAVNSSKIGNAFGLFDVHGNVWEWCADEWHAAYNDGAPVDGTAWLSSANPTRRVLRGGAWCNRLEICRASERISELADAEGKLFYLGFRIAASPDDLPKY